MKFLHKFMRAVGFSEYADRKRLKELLTNVILHADERYYTMNQENVLLGEFRKNFTKDIGIAVCGEFDEEYHFIYEYYYPYLMGNEVTTTEDVNVERHAARESYGGICDDMNVGISLIFYLQNMIPYVKAQCQGKLPIKGTSLTLTGLSVSGVIMLPIKKDEEQRRKVKRDTATRNNLLAAARKGDLGRYGYVHCYIQKNSEGRCVQLGGYLFYALRHGMRPVFCLRRNSGGQSKGQQPHRRKALSNEA